MKQKHGTEWKVNPLEGANRKGLLLGYGYPEPTGKFIHQLRTLERDSEHGNFFESVRYFEKEDEND